MSSLMNRFPVACLVCVLATGYSTFLGQAQSVPRPRANGGSQATQDPSAPATSKARFRTVPVTTPVTSTTVYAPNYDPYGSYWSGVADVVNNMLAPEVGSLQQQQVKQARVQTRRMQLDEHLYERAVTPTREDERERARIENLRRSRNDPPLTEIWSGTALNELLLAIQQQMAQGVRGPAVPLQEDVIRNINVISGANNGSIGMLKDGGRLIWPLTLRGAEYKEEYDKVDQLAYSAYKQADSGQVDADTLEGLTSTVNKLEAHLRRNVSDINPNNYIAAKRFIDDMKSTIRVLQDPNVSNYVTRKWAARGNTVADLTAQMTRDGLRFAPATPGDQAAYVALQRAMVAYAAPPGSYNSWDPLAK